MLEVKPIENKHEREALAARCRIRLRRDALMYAAYREEEPVSVASFQCVEGLARFYAVTLCDRDFPDRLHALRLTLLGGLAFAAENGCTRFDFDGSIPTELIYDVGLRSTEEGTYTIW